MHKKIVKYVLLAILIIPSFTLFSTSFSLAPGDTNSSGNVEKVETGDAGILSGDGITQEKLRKGDIHTDDIPGIIKGAIDFLMGIAGTIAVIFVIIGAYQILFIGAIEQNKTKGKETIIMAITGFAISALAWAIIRFIIDNFN